VYRLFDLPPFALELCRRLGANPKSLELLQGGMNSQVFRCKAGSHWHVIKGFSSRPTSGHDRLKAEVGLLNYAQMVAPDFVPRLLHIDEESRSVVLEYIEGERFEAGRAPSSESVGQAIAFMRRLNEDYEIARQYVSGSAAEGFLRLTEHLKNIDQRLRLMDVEHVPEGSKRRAQWLIDAARRRLTLLQDCTEQLISEGYCADAFDPQERCISPGDYGFHNAIRTPSGVKFFDFEFAGWDDPSKAVADFDLQPKVPVSPKRQALAGAIRTWNTRYAVRHKVLAPILELKWACIILGQLNPSRWAEITQIDPTQALEPLLQAKLQSAENYLFKD
jgi:hypothetical protein